MATFVGPPPIDDMRRAGTDSHLRTLPAGTELWRVYFRGGAHPTTWNTFRTFGPIVSARFDHHEPPPHEQRRAILYAAIAGPICLAEVFQETRVIDRSRNAPWLVSFRITGQINALDLTGLWPTLAGGSQEINNGDRHDARRWSRAIYTAFPQVDGLWYRSKMHGGMPCLALFERAGRVMAALPSFHAALASPDMFDVVKDTANQIGYVVL
ncbi:MAG: RES family NAD+ phosphorylase [Chloroflexota bacterium]|nr:RES family NAD+ phosphorylase [Chloroflexota bacterium]MDQ6908606.1 RES family NAD+ phosphorylase [Chloroflexota bacterium]